MPRSCARGSARCTPSAGSASTGRSSTAGAARRSSQVAIYNEELARAGAPPLLGRAGHHARRARRSWRTAPRSSGARWMPRILAGDDVWCQLFSEPDAGSDLAAPRRRAPSSAATRTASPGRRCGRRTRGSPTGRSRSCRTDPDAPPHQGISMLAIPMDAPGVEVRPLRQITGESEFNEVFLDDVEVPVDALHRPGARGLARRQHDARQRARAPRSSGRSRCCTSWRRAR